MKADNGNIFSQLLRNLSDDQFEAHLSKFNPENYSGVTIDEILSMSCDESHTHTFSFTNRDWFTLNLAYLDYVNQINLNAISLSESYNNLIYKLFKLDYTIVNKTIFDPDVINSNQKTTNKTSQYENVRFFYLGLYHEQRSYTA